MRVFPRPRRAHLGFSLIETMLVAAVILAAIAGIYRYYSSVAAKEAAHRDSQNAIALTNAIASAYSQMSNFSGLSDQQLISQGVVPNTLMTNGSTVIQDSFGGAITVAPATLDGDANRGFSVTYGRVPSGECAAVVSAINKMQRFDNIALFAGGSAGGQGSQGTVVSTEGNMDPSALVQACAASSTIDIQMTFRRQSGGSIATLAQCVAPPTSQQTLACPTGYTGSITQQQTWSCPSFYAAPVGSGWSTTSDTCQLICVPDPSSPQSETLACPTGDLGSIVDQRVSTCAGTTGTPTWGPWTQVSDNCQPACIVPSPQVQTLACPTGMSGTNVEHMYATCPPTVAPYPAPVGSPTWGPWVDDGDTCACALPSPATQYQWVNQTGSCPTGTWGTETYQEQQVRTATCPSSSQPFQWSAWTNTGVTQNINTSGCTPDCAPDATTEWQNETGTCAAGYNGTITWQEKFTRTSVCASPQSPAPTDGPWVDSGVSQNNVNTCAPDGCSVTAGTSRSWSVSGQTCSTTLGAQNIASGAYATATANSNGTNGTANFQCSLGVLSSTPLAGATCAADSCTVAAGTSRSWTVGAQTCTATVGATTVASGGSVSFGENITGKQGSASFACLNGVLSSTASAGDSCNACGAAPVTTRTATCAAGQYGYYTQQEGYSETTYPTCWTATGAWSNTGGPGCNACPANYTTSSTYWVNNVAVACPANEVQAGTDNVNGATESQNYTQTNYYTYSCPAGTTSLPGATRYNTTSAFNGGTANYSSSNCSYTCAVDLSVWAAYNPGPAAGADGEGAPTAYQETRTAVVSTTGCPIGYYGGTVTTYQPQHRYLYCPDGNYGMGPIFQPGVGGGYPNPASNPGYYYAGGWSSNGASYKVNTCVPNGCPLAVGVKTYTANGVPTAQPMIIKCP